jgi:hypothetical protein
MMFELTPLISDLNSQIAIRALTSDVLTCTFPFKRYGLLKIGGRGCIGTCVAFIILESCCAGFLLSYISFWRKAERYFLLIVTVIHVSLSSTSFLCS